MNRNCPTVDAYLSLEDFADEYLSLAGLRAYIVVRNSEIVGLITSHDMQRIARDLWSQTSVQGAMRRIGQIGTVSPEAPAVQALAIMNRQGIDQLLVIVNGRLEGVISRLRVLNFLQNHLALIAANNFSLARGNFGCGDDLAFWFNWKLSFASQHDRPHE